MTIQTSPLVKYQSASADQATNDDKDLTVQRPYFANISTDTDDDSMLDHKTSLSEKPANELVDLHRAVSQEFQQLKDHLQRSSTRIRSQFSRVRARLLMIARRKQDKMENTNTELANEHKATRVLAVVFACFFTCWAPFFIMNFTIGFCGDQCAMPAWLVSVILWLGYLSSTLNPVIYTTFNRRFREAFLRIIRCQCLKSRDGGTYSRSHVFLTGDATWLVSLKPNKQTCKVNYDIIKRPIIGRAWTNQPYYITRIVRTIAQSPFKMALQKLSGSTI